MKSIISSLLLPLTLLSCGYDGGYRYSCQDPENWNKESCNPPTCLGYGECINDIYGFDPREVTK